MYTTLLTIHLICVAMWLGGAIYERVFLVGNIRRQRGTGMELGLIRMMLSTELYFMVITICLLATGITMSILSGAGFFHMSWLGFKQMVMVVGLLGFLTYVAPRMRAVKKEVEQSIELGTERRELVRAKVGEMTRGFDIIHLGVVLNLILAVWKP